MKLSVLVKSKRDELSLTVRALADRADVSTGQVAGIEAGRNANLTVLMAARLSEALRVDFHKLVDAARESAEELARGSA